MSQIVETSLIPFQNVVIHDGIVMPYRVCLGKNMAEQAIRGKGAFRRFKDCLFDLGMEQEWYKYRDACYEKIAREWCEKHGITAEV